MSTESSVQPTGPYVMAAMFCEALLQEGDDLTGAISAIRILESIQMESELVLEASSPDQVGTFDGPPTPITLNLLVMLRGLLDEHEHNVSITPIRPSGKRGAQPMVAQIKAGGYARGANLKAELNVRFTENGLYWFEIALDEQVLTRIPLRIDAKSSVTLIAPQSDASWREPIEAEDSATRTENDLPLL